MKDEIYAGASDAINRHVWLASVKSTFAICSAQVQIVVLTLILYFLLTVNTLVLILSTITWEENTSIYERTLRTETTKHNQNVNTVFINSH